MKYINIESWNRKEHFYFFKSLDYPQINICGNLDITRFCQFIKEKNKPFFVSFLYLSTKIANQIKEFRYRIQGDNIVEHERVRPSFTLMTSKGVFTFLTVEFIDNFDEFVSQTTEKMEIAKDQFVFDSDAGHDDLLYITSIPWISFTSITHPIHMHPVDSVPRISWGKFFNENDSLKLPFSIQAHHALVDGAHIGEFFMELQNILDNPESLL